ncbi:MAG: hypothetical protein I3I94_09070 [Acidaminococcaceae bacterium]|nr:hypothetical protein [Acidaminococcaceae bacterium]
MTRLVRHNEVQYSDDEERTARLMAEGFVIDKPAAAKASAASAKKAARRTKKGE